LYDCFRVHQSHSGFFPRAHLRMKTVLASIRSARPFRLLLSRPSRLQSTPAASATAANFGASSFLSATSPQSPLNTVEMGGKPKYELKTPKGTKDCKSQAPITRYPASEKSNSHP
jgi:hypothetical protein